jgi:hypothetical protein
MDHMKETTNICFDEVTSRQYNLANVVGKGSMDNAGENFVALSNDEEIFFEKCVSME